MFCQFPVDTFSGTALVKIRIDRDLPVRVGPFELVFGRERSKRHWFRIPYRDNHGDPKLGIWHWNSFAPRR